MLGTSRKGDRMPAAYTHLTFGLAVEKELTDPDIQKIFTEHKELYLIGLHGPDILFYYNALSKNPINRQGNAMHYVPARAFFERGKGIMDASEDKDASMAYLLGFICHLALDHACHSYVEYCMRNSALSHTEIETYLDRSYLLLDEINPIKHNITSHIVVSAHAGQVIAPFFQDVTPEQVTRALRQMKQYNGLLLPTNPLKEGFIRLALKVAGQYDSLQGLIMKHASTPDVDRMIQKLQMLLTEAVPTAADMIKQYYQYCHNNASLDTRFDNHYSFTEELIELIIREN